MPLLLTLNAGSSSLKFALFDQGPNGQRRLGAGEAEGLGLAGGWLHTRAGDAPAQHRPLAPGAGGVADHAAALAGVLDWLRRAYPGREVAAVSHRVVHGGPDLVAPVALDEVRLAQLRELVPLAPLHQPHNLAGIAAAQAAFPAARQVACFDTAFHRQHPFVADTFALPRRYYDEGVRRYGFHGLSYESITGTLRRRHPALHAGRVVVAHLGNGASMCAIRGGRSVASTMGFTALDGLPMGTRCGQIDPGVLLYLLQARQMDPQALADLLYRESGLKGLSGLSHDVRVLEAAGTPAARDALAYFTDRCRRELGGLAVSLGGLDAVVLTGGIGEHAVGVRRALLQDLQWLGIVLDEAANEAGGPVISAPGSAVAVLVLPTDEEAMLAHHAAAHLGWCAPEGAA